MIFMCCIKISPKLPSLGELFPHTAQLKSSHMFISVEVLADVQIKCEKCLCVSSITKENYLEQLLLCEKTSNFGDYALCTLQQRLNP